MFVDLPLYLVCVSFIRFVQWSCVAVIAEIVTSSLNNIVSVFSNLLRARTLLCSHSLSLHISSVCLLYPKTHTLTHAISMLLSNLTCLSIPSTYYAQMFSHCNENRFNVLFPYTVLFQYRFNCGLFKTLINLFSTFFRTSFRI